MKCPPGPREQLLSWFGGNAPSAWTVFAPDFIIRPGRWTASLFLTKGEAQRLSTLPSQTDAAASQKHCDDLEIMHVFRDRLNARKEPLPELADQLRAAVQQTELAVIEISEKFMNIAGRARRQLQATSDIVGSMVQDQQAASGSDVDRTAKVEKFVSTLEGLSVETEMLGKDINGIITSLQFQDITRQEIEKVISRIAQFQQELSEMKRNLEQERASVPGPEGPCVVGAGVKRGEHV